MNQRYFKLQYETYWIDSRCLGNLRIAISNDISATSVCCGDACWYCGQEGGGHKCWCVTEALAEVKRA